MIHQGFQDTQTSVSLLAYLHGDLQRVALGVFHLTQFWDLTSFHLAFKISRLADGIEQERDSRLKLYDRFSIMIGTSRIQQQAQIRSSTRPNTYHRRVGNERGVLAIEFIRLENCVSVPVGPVHPVPKKRDTKRMFEHLW